MLRFDLGFCPEGPCTQIAFTTGLKVVPMCVYIYIYLFICLSIWGFPKIRGTLFGYLIRRILLFRVLYQGPLFSETPTCTLIGPTRPSLLWFWDPNSIVGVFMDPLGMYIYIYNIYIYIYIDNVILYFIVLYYIILFYIFICTLGPGFRAKGFEFRVLGRRH